MSIPKIGLELKTTVPEASMGRLVDAITDIIRPVTETLGLVGDHVKLHRAETALKVAKLGMQIAYDSGDKLELIPIKGLVPLLEKSSLEDPLDNKMIGKWANLLASAATDPTVPLARLSSILAELNVHSAEILERIIARHHDLTKWSAEELAINVSEYSGDWIVNFLKRDDINKEVSGKEFLEAVLVMLDEPGVAVDAVQIEDENEIIDWPITPEDYNDSRGFRHDIEGFSLLTNLGLIERQSFQDITIGPFLVTVWFHVVTALGFYLYSRCNPDKLKYRFPPRLDVSAP